MDLNDFITVGENIHCTRSVKSGGIKTVQLPEGVEAVGFECEGSQRTLPVPGDWESHSPDYGSGKIKHTALAIHQILNGEAKQDGEDYLRYMAARQIDGGAMFLDVNVDEYSPDAGKNTEIMSFVSQFYSYCDTPLSIDSSNPAILRAGLENCRTDISQPMINSVSLERPDVVDMAAEFNAHVIVSAAGREDLPNELEGRLANFREIIGMLDKAGVPREKMHLDPLCFPISTDPGNGNGFLEAVTKSKEEFGPVNLNGGLSNISFGMPNRRLLNLVFIDLCVEAGANGGIIDPVSTPISAVAALDRECEPYHLARAVLTGEDQFGMQYITAHREGRLEGAV
jgi:5-methyltetrahydrofolate--homocysteine methyltransferase